MKKNFVVIGIGNFGYSVARTLYSLGHDVLAIDSSEELVEDISPFVTQAVQADATDEGTLKSLGIANMDTAIIAMGDDIKSSVLTTLLCKELGARSVVVKAQDELHGKVLSKIGADRVVYPEREMGARIAQSLVSSNILECIGLSDKYNIAEIDTPEEWDNKTLKELALRTDYGINVVAVKNADGEIRINPHGEDVLADSDVLVVIGTMEDIRNIEKYAKKKK
jgi:trk system potassium uptake protein